MARQIIQLLIFASLVLSVYMIVVTLERCRSEKRYGFVYCIVTLMLYTLGYFIEISSGNVDSAVVAIKIMYGGGCFMSPFFFFFAADYCELRIPKKFYKIPLLVIPVLFYGVVLTFDKHQLLYRNYFYDFNKVVQGMTIEPGPLYLVGTFYPLFCIGLSFVVLVRGIISQSRGRRFGLILLLISALAPLIANFSYVALSFFFKTGLAGINFTAYIMLISNFIFFFNIIRNDMFDLAPRAHAVTLDLIRDAFVILDRGMAYTGSNKKAQELFPGLSVLQKGSSILSLESWPTELTIKDSDSVADEELQFSLPQRAGMIYSGWRNRVSSESGATLGWVILIQDITGTVKLINSIRSQRDQIAAMRDNLKEGLFLMDRDFLIQDSCSKVLEDILGDKNLPGKSFTGFLGNSFRERERELIADYFTMIMNKSATPELLEEINPLEEFLYTGTEESGEVKRTLRCAFAPVDQENGETFVMGTVQDISAEVELKKQLASQEERRQEEMRSLFDVMHTDQNVFRDFCEDTDEEFGRLSETLGNKNLPLKEALVGIYQSVHAVKSNAVISGLSCYGEKLHRLETEIKNLRDREGDISPGDMDGITAGLEGIKREKKNLIEILERIKNFSREISAGNSGAVKTEEEVFTDALKITAEKVASGEQKKVSLIVDKFDREALVHSQRRVIKDILVQLVRNAVHHGIEPPEKRLVLGKTEKGKISLSVTVESGEVRIILRDDGEGLDFERIAKKAEEKGLLKNPEAERTNQQFLLNLIFTPGFSTSETENLHAGRGIGLSLVRDRLRELKGTTQVQSKKGRGLTFDIRIPAHF